VLDTDSIRFIALVAATAACQAVPAQERLVGNPNCRRQTVRDSSPAGLIAALTRIDPTQLIGVGVMDLFGAEKIATVREQSAEICRLCGTKLALVRVIIDSDTGNTYRMFECKCGERIWND
jgi:hypothetical protein